MNFLLNRLFGVADAKKTDLQGSYFRCSGSGILQIAVLHNAKLVLQIEMIFL